MAIEKCCEVYKNDPCQTVFYLERKNNKIKSQTGHLPEVIYHLIEEEVYENYMNQLFRAATRYVIIEIQNLQVKTQPLYFDTDQSHSLINEVKFTFLS
jgi:hypothetical protein